MNNPQNPIKIPRLTKNKNNNIKYKDNRKWNVIIIKIGTYIFIEKNWNISCLSNLIKNPFCTFLGKLFLKDGKIDNHWVGPSLKKLVYAEWFQRRKDTKKGGEEKNDDFDIDIIEEFALDMALNYKKKTQTKPPMEKNNKRQHKMNILIHQK